MKTRILTITLLLFSVKTFGQIPEVKLRISQLTDNVYIYTTWKTYDDKPPVTYPANGMYVVTQDGVIMIDSPFDTTQFQPLLDSINARHHQEVVMCIATHSHDDRSAGLEYYSQQGIKTYTSWQTDEISKKNKEKRAQYLFTSDTTFTVGGCNFQTYYPGAGHSPDNIVIWFDKEKILYGGCFIKSTESKELGNLKDADVKTWKASAEKVAKKFPDCKYIIPGHYSWENINSLKHTQKLVDQFLKNIEKN